MRLYEYEGKELYREAKIDIPAAGTAATVQEAREVASRIGYPVVIKAQVLAGGRGKAGLIKVAGNEAESARYAGEILAASGEGKILLVEKKIDATAEGYIGITLDDQKGTPVVIISRQGGIDIEEMAAADKGSMVSAPIDVQRGFAYHDAVNLAKRAGYVGDILVKVADIAHKMYRLFARYDAGTVEINPVLINDQTKDVLAGDAKVIIEDYALYRQPRIQGYLEKRHEPKRSFEYVPLGGNIGIVSAGASNTMMVCDAIKVMGGEPANFMDIIGGAGPDAYYEMCKFVFDNANTDQKIKVVLINITFAATPLKNFVDGCKKALLEAKPRVPVVACVRAAGASVLGMSLEEGNSVLRQFGIEVIGDLEEAIKKAITIAEK